MKTFNIESHELKELLSVETIFELTDDEKSIGKRHLINSITEQLLSSDAISDNKTLLRDEIQKDLNETLKSIIGNLEIYYNQNILDKAMDDIFSIFEYDGPLDIYDEIVDILITLFSQDEKVDESNLKYEAIYDLNLREVELFVKELLTFEMWNNTRRISSEYIVDMICLKIKYAPVYEELKNVRNPEQFEKLQIENKLLRNLDYAEVNAVKFYSHN